MIDIKRLKRQNLRLKLMLIISYILFTCLIFLAIYLVYNYILTNQSVENFKKDASHQGKIESEYLQKIYLDGYHTLSAINLNDTFKRFLENKDPKEIDSLFVTLMNEHKNFMQLRFLDKNGYEIVRYDRDFKGSLPKKSKIFQNKSHREYFKAVNNKHIVYFSPLDLNMEQKRIEKPIKEVLRISLPVFDKGLFDGVLVVNIFIAPFLEHLSTLSGLDVYLVDRYGFFILAPEKSLHWSRFFSKKTIVTKLSIPLNELTQTPHFYEKECAFVQPLGIDSTNSPYLVYLQSAKREQMIQKDMLKSGMYAFLIAFILAFPFSYIIAYPISTIFKSLQVNSEKLTLMANNLERQISKEIEKSRQKDRLLENNAKLVALGEMIGNIAHQWRHPLTRLSLIIQNLSHLDTCDEKNKVVYNRYIKNSLEQINYMSDTIEDFRNFYNESGKKNLFLPRTSVQDAMTIIGGVIRHEGINMMICTDGLSEIYGFQNRFAQVILNLLHNAKDALKDEENPYIRVFIVTKDNLCKVSVVDNGCGISEENIQKIFNSKFSTKKDGSGIGLYLSKLIIKENFNGKIEAKSLPKGAKFTITLPIG